MRGPMVMLFPLVRHQWYETGNWKSGAHDFFRLSKCDIRQRPGSNPGELIGHGHINSGSVLISRPVLVSSGHQRQWKELNNALVSAITDIVERWWTNSVSRFPERMPLKPAEEDLLRVCYVPPPTVHPAAGSGTFSQQHDISDPIEEFPRHRDCSYEEAPPRYFALQVLREDRCRGGVLSGMDVGKLSSPAVRWDARPSRTFTKC